MTVETLTVPGLNLWTAPAGITEVLVELYGSQGGPGSAGGSDGGEGGIVVVNVAVTPGDTYNFPIANMGGTSPSSGIGAFTGNGGYGYGGRGQAGGGNGGTFTGMYATVGGLVLYALAGGGGGGTPSITGRPGGAGGDATGEQGYPQGGPFPTVIPAGAGGGTQTAGGGSGLGDNGYGSYPGSLSSGGDCNDPNPTDRGGGGGGGGYYGGGGGGRGYGGSGYGSGGGGGSNHINLVSTSAILATITDDRGGNTGAGWVRLTYGPEGGWGYNLSFGQRGPGL